MPSDEQFHWLYEVQSQCHVPAPVPTPPLTALCSRQLAERFLVCFLLSNISHRVDFLHSPKFPAPYASLLSTGIYWASTEFGPSLKPKRGAKSRVLCSTNWGQALPGAWWVSFASKSGRSVPCNWWGMIGFGHSVKAGSWIWDETGRGPNS